MCSQSFAFCVNSLPRATSLLFVCPPLPSPSQRYQVAEIRVVWDAFDTDKSGSIDSNELAKILEQLSNGTVGTVQHIWKDIPRPCYPSLRTKERAKILNSNPRFYFDLICTYQHSLCERSHQADARHGRQRRRYAALAIGPPDKYPTFSHSCPRLTAQCLVCLIPVWRCDRLVTSTLHRRHFVGGVSGRADQLAGRRRRADRRAHRQQAQGSARRRLFGAYSSFGFYRSIHLSIDVWSCSIPAP